MSEGLRAEDVKAPSDLSPEMEAVYEVVDRLWHDLEALFGALLPLAKGGLASQEQTPDIMISRNEDGEWPESVTSRIHLYDAQGREFSGVMILDYVEHAFHPPNQKETSSEV